MSRPTLALIMMGMSVVASILEISGLIAAVWTYYNGDIQRATFTLAGAIYMAIVARSLEARARSMSP